MGLYNESMDKQLRESAEKSFEQLGGEEKARAEADRMQIGDWLAQVGEAYLNPAAAVSDTVVTATAEAIDAHCTGEGLTKVVKALAQLSEDEMYALARAAATGAFGAGTGATLMSRRVSESGVATMWKPTGFVSDGEAMTLSVKIGDEPYQPIGAISDDYYLGTDGSKTLWLREFSMCITYPWSPPFRVTRAEVDDLLDGQYREMAMSSTMKGNAEGAIEMFEEDLLNERELVTRLEESEGMEQEEYDKLVGDLKDTRDKMREGVKLAAVQVPVLGEVLRDLAERHPELGEDLGAISDSEVGRLVHTCLEYLRKKLDDLEVLRQVEAEIHADELPREERRKLLLTRLLGMARESLVVEEDGGEPDNDRIMTTLSIICTACPSVYNRVEDGTPLEMVESIVAYLEAELGVKPESEDKEPDDENE